MKVNNIYPAKFSISRSDQELLLNQKAKVLWLTGLSGAGKTTLALNLSRLLYSNGKVCKILDGDNLRSGVTKNIGFSDEERSENIRLTAEIAKLFLDAGIIVIVALISPFKKDRENAKSIIGEKDFIEIYLDTPLEVCEKRDPKGLYKKSRAGHIKNMTGIDSPYEKPVNPDFIFNGNIAEILDILNG